MRIFWITKLSDKNPFKSTQMGVSSALRKRGHDVTLVLMRHFSEKKPSTNEIMYLPTIDKPFFSGFIYGLIILFYFSFSLKKEKTDIVIFDGDQIFSPFVLTIKLLRIPIIWDIRSLPIDKEKSILHDISFYLTKYFTDALTTITPELKEILIEKYRLQNMKIGLWSSGVSTDIFNKDNLKTLENLDTRNKEFILIHHGTYSPTRGIEELILSIAKIKEDIRKNVLLLLVGIPNYKHDDLLDLCNQIGVKENVSIIPPVAHRDIPSFIEASDVGVIPLPPNNEWWKVSVPLKTLEYLVMGKPVIVTDIPFHRKIFDRCNCGIITKTGNPEDISDAIEILYNKRNELKTMGENGKKLVEKNYSWDQKALELENFIKYVMENK